MRPHAGRHCAAIRRGAGWWAEAERQRAREAHKLGNASVAAAAFEAALAADPLDPAAHEAFLAFRTAGAGGRG